MSRTLTDGGSVKSDQDDPRFVFGHKTRLVILLLSTLSLMFIICNVVALNFSVICIFKEGFDDHFSHNHSVPHHHQKKELLYTPTEQNWLFSANAIGILSGTFPITYLTIKLGAKKVITIYGMTSAISTLLMPVAIRSGYVVAFICRAFQGYGVAITFPAMGSIVAEWATLRKSGTYAAWMSTYLQLAQVFTMPVAGTLCESSLGWPATFYIQGSITFVLFIAFWFFYEDSPSRHRFVSRKELSTLQKNKTIRSLEESRHDKVPYKAILTDKAIIGILLSFFGTSVGFQIFFQYGPIYLNQVQGYDIRKTGAIAALPFVISVVAKLIGGPCVDKIPFLGDKARIILFASVTQYSLAVVMLLLALLPIGEQIWLLVCYNAAVALSGLNLVTASKASQMISGRFIHFIMALNMFTTSIIILFVPMMVAVFAPNGDPAEWAGMFIGVAVLIVIVTTIFNATARVKPAKWAEDATDHPAKPRPAIFHLNVGILNIKPKRKALKVTPTPSYYSRQEEIDNNMKN